MSDNTTNLVIAGDSIGRGQVTSSDNWANLNIPGSYTVENMSLNGTTVHDQSTMFESSILSNYNAADKSNWLVIQAGTNDLGQGTSASDLYQQVQKFASDAHAAGYKVLVATVLPRNDAVFSWTDADEKNRLAYNNLVRSNSIGADAVADIASHPVMGSTASTTQLPLYIDGLHPSASAVRNYLEPIYSDAINSANNSTSAAGGQQTGSVTGVGSTSPVQSSQPSSTTPVSGSSSSLPSSTASTGSSATVGSGPDQLLLHLNESAYQGDAQFTVSVDGQQVGGVQSAHTERGAGSDDLLVQGDWAAGNHKFSVNFINDLYGGSSSADRNLYLQSGSYNGSSITSAHYDLMADGAVSFMFQDTGQPSTAPGGLGVSSPATTLPPATSSGSSASSSTVPAQGTNTASGAGQTSTIPSVITIGSGPDQLLLNLSEDAYKGDAQYTVSVDGQQVGGVQTAYTARGKGADHLLVEGDWTAGNHTFAVNFINDLNGGSPGADRNLYLESGTYNGVDIASAHYDLMAGGAVGFIFQDTTGTAPTSVGSGGAPSTTNSTTPASTLPSSGGTYTSTAGSGSTPSVTTVGSGSHALLLHLNEDAYQGDAQFTVSVDGQQIGGVQTTHALRGQGTDALLIKGDWTQGNHSFAINFTNDAYGGSPNADRNLYLQSGSLDGANVANAHYDLMAGGPVAFKFKV